MGAAALASGSLLAVVRGYRSRKRRALQQWLNERGLVSYEAGIWQGEIDQQWVHLRIQKGGTRLELRFWPELDLELLVCFRKHIGLAPKLPREELGPLLLFARSRARLSALFPQELHQPLINLAAHCQVFTLRDDGMRLFMDRSLGPITQQNTLLAALEVMAGLELARQTIRCSKDLAGWLPGWQYVAAQYGLQLMQTPLALCGKFNGLNVVANAYRHPPAPKNTNIHGTHGLDVTAWFDQPLGEHFLLKPVQQGYSSFEQAFEHSDGVPVEDVVTLSPMIQRRMLELLNAHGALTLNENSLWLRQVSGTSAENIPMLMKLIGELARDIEDHTREPVAMLGYRTSARAALGP